jgi:hypothetical protein
MRDAMGDSPAEEPELKQRIGDYELIERIAQGGMGVVFKARQISVGRTVALKMILGGVLATEIEVQRFAAEAEAAANLDHPNIVPIYEIGAHQGRHFYTMKFVEGGDLSAHLENYRDPIAAARLIATCARAVHHGHRRGVLHRDLKPANILLDVDGVPHVTDFGVAKRLDTEAITPGTLTGTLLGTPAYMAPEQAAGKVRDITTAADIYSLGAILYHLVTGRPPFIAESLGEQLRLITEQPVTRPRTVNKRIDTDLETILLKCLEKDRRARYATASDLADDLEKYAAGEPIRARPVGRIGRWNRWIKRNPIPAAVALLLAASLITVTTAALLVARDAERARLDEILTGNAYTARAVAGTVQRQIEVFSRAVTEAARDENFRAALAASDPAPLREHVRRMLDEHNRPGTPWRTSASAREPFTSFFVVDASGVMRAHAPMYREAGEDFSRRDYFQSARQFPDGQPYVSRLYKAKTDGKYKIAIAVPVRRQMTTTAASVESRPPSPLAGEGGGEGGARGVDDGRSAESSGRGVSSRTTAEFSNASPRNKPARLHSDPPHPNPLPPGERRPDNLLGLLVASISIDSQFGDLQLDDDVRKVALVCPLDPGRESNVAGEREQLVLLRHPRYADQNTAHFVTSQPLADFVARGEPQTDRKYFDRLFGDWYLASFARVPNTPIVVVVQQRYGDALRAGVDPARRIVLWGGAALALAAITIAIASAVMLNRRAAAAAR